jgi:hypothetical protein
MKFVLFYESAHDVMTKAPQFFPDHWARCHEFHGRGQLLMVGTFEDPLTQGSMGIFTSREAAEEFVADDPFVLNGVVARWEVRGWNEALAAPDPDHDASTGS